MEEIKSNKPDPYQALRYREFNIFLLLRFAMVFAWSMQFIVIEWEVYSLTKNPLSLGIIGLMEIIPAVSMSLFAGHIVDQREKKSLLVKCILGFSVISFGLFLLTWPKVVGGWSTHIILYSIYALVFFGGIVRSFMGPTIFSLLSLIIPKKYIQMLQLGVVQFGKLERLWDQHWRVSQLTGLEFIGQCVWFSDFQFFR